jgi:hypothetical protein
MKDSGGVGGAQKSDDYPMVDDGLYNSYASDTEKDHCSKMAITYCSIVVG